MPAWRFCLATPLPPGDRHLSHPRHTLPLLSMDAVLLSSAPVDDLAEAIGQLHAAGCAVHKALLELVAAFDRRRFWEVDGSTSMAAWLVARLGLSYGVATSWVETADRLAWLPGLAGAYEEGRLSWDQVRAAAEVAVVGTEEAVLAEALASTAAHLERRARRHRETAHRLAEVVCSLRWWWERRGTQWRLSGCLPPDQGAVVAAALAAIADRASRVPETGMYAPYHVRMAEALVELAEGRPAGEEPGPATLVVHVDADALATGEGTAQVEDGPALPAEAARRLACNARVESVAEGADGRIVGIGRASRAVPPWLARQVRHRDQGCRFPGCERTRWAHLHHLVHWAEGGPTDLANPSI